MATQRTRQDNASTPRADGAPALAVEASRLEAALLELARCYEKMDALAGARREAVRSVSHRRLTETLTAEAAEAGSVARLNQARADAVRRIEGHIGRPETGPTTASWIAGRIGGETGERLAGAADRLREAIGGVRDALRSDRLALETLEAHARGLLQAAASCQSHAGTYGRSGAFESRREQVVSSMDLTS